MTYTGGTRECSTCQRLRPEECFGLRLDYVTPTTRKTCDDCRRKQKNRKRYGTDVARQMEEPHPPLVLDSFLPMPLPLDITVALVARAA